MRLKSIVSYILCLALAMILLSSCSGGSETVNTETDRSDAPVDTSPVDPAEFPDAEEILEEAFEIPVCAEDEFTYTVGADGVTVTGYTGDCARVSIPETVKGVPVVAVADGAFANNAALTALVIPDSVLKIGKGILSGCSSLKALRTPLLGEAADQPQYLGYLFGSERYEDNPRDVPVSLEVLSVSGAWESLPAYALYDCNDLVLVSLPSTVRVLEKFSLSRCASLIAIDGLSYVRELGEYSLSYCEALKAISLDAQVERIGFAALEGCYSLGVLSLPFVGETATENTYLGYIFGAAYPDFAKGYYPPTLERVEVLGGRTLGENAFFECATLKEVTLPEGLETVGVRAFFGCEKLWSVTLPDTVSAVRESAFAGCDSLLSATLGVSLTTLGINAFLNCDSLTSIVLPDTLTALPSSAFSGCASLEIADLGGVKTVGAQAFRGCRALKTVIADGEVDFAEGNETVEKILKNVKEN